MSQNKEFEERGQNVDQAIRSGLDRLGLDRDEVIVEVIDEGSRGLLGIGSRDAIVLLKPLATPNIIEPDKPTSPAKSVPVTPKSKPVAHKSPKRVQATPVAVAPAPEAVEENIPEPKVVKADVSEKNETAVSSDSSDASDSTQAVSSEQMNVVEETEAEKEVALDVVKTVLDKMNVQANITATLSEPDDMTGKRINIIEISGEDLGVLIGQRGETLNSIQYITRLMVAHKIHRRADFVVDVSQYRQRREQALTRMAERMAGKVVKRNAPVTLEPMPPNERRIIHMALRNDEAVYTHSVGEGNRRKIRISPKKA